MSLDIYIISPTPIKKKSTGIWVRDNGKTRELSKAEAQEKYPDADIQEIEIETNEFWHGNITHNLNKMAQECKIECDTQHEGLSLYDLLWRDEYPWEMSHLEYTQCLMACLVSLTDEPERYKLFNPSNGWGTYEQLVEFVKSFIHALVDEPYEMEIKYSK